MCSASASTSSASPITTSSIASSNSSGKRDMCTPFCAGSRSTTQSISAGICRSTPRWRKRIAFSIPWTPARESPIRTSGVEAWRSSCSTRPIEFATLADMAGDPAFAQLVSLACHDLRTPLATVNGFARTLTRLEDLDDPLPRYLGMMATAAEQMNELLDDLGLVARIEGARWEQAPSDTDTLALAEGAAKRVGAPVAVEDGGARARELRPLRHPARQRRRPRVRRRRRRGPPRAGELRGGADPDGGEPAGPRRGDRDPRGRGARRLLGARRGDARRAPPRELGRLGRCDRAERRRGIAGAHRVRRAGAREHPRPAGQQLVQPPVAE